LELVTVITNPLFSLSHQVPYIATFLRTETPPPGRDTVTTKTPLVNN